MLLCLDTSSATTIVVLTVDGEVLASAIDASGAHERVVMPLVREVLGGVPVRELDGIVAGVGPGPFTGLRVGLASARVLGRAIGVPVYGVCSLDALAADVDPIGPFAVTADAKRRELYWATYDESGARTSGPAVGRPGDVSRAVAGLPVAGIGPQRYPEFFAPAIEPSRVTASGLARIAVRPESRLAPWPLYLREPDAVAAQVRKPVTQSEPR